MQLSARKPWRYCRVTGFRLSAEEIGYPVVIKINTPRILHKTDIGAVVIDVRSNREVKTAFASLKKKITKLKALGQQRFSVSVQEMISDGVETVIGMTTDPSFGPLIMFGLLMKEMSMK